MPRNALCTVLNITQPSCAEPLKITRPRCTGRLKITHPSYAGTLQIWQSQAVSRCEVCRLLYPKLTQLRVNEGSRCAHRAETERHSPLRIYDDTLAGTSRTTGGAVCMATAQSTDIVQFLCWLDLCSNRRRTVVHAMHCTQVGTVELSGCSTQPGECAKRHAHDSLKTNYVSKLAVAYERDLGITTDWSDILRIGNPIRSDMITQYMMFPR